LKRWLLRIAIFLAVLVIVVPTGLFFYWRSQVREGIRLINAICDTPEKTSLNALLARADELGLSTDRKDDLHFDVFTGGENPQPVDPGKEYKGLPELNVTFTRFRWLPFESDYCTVSLKNGKVTKSRVGYLD
jgi:hypothetical protein